MNSLDWQCTWWVRTFLRWKYRWYSWMVHRYVAQQSYGNEGGGGGGRGETLVEGETKRNLVGLEIELNEKQQRPRDNQYDQYNYIRHNRELLLCVYVPNLVGVAMNHQCCKTYKIYSWWVLFYVMYGLHFVSRSIIFNELFIMLQGVLYFWFELNSITSDIHPIYKVWNKKAYLAEAHDICGDAEFWWQSHLVGISEITLLHIQYIKRFSHFVCNTTGHTSSNAMQ